MTHHLTFCEWVEQHIDMSDKSDAVCHYTKNLTPLLVHGILQLFGAFKLFFFRFNKYETYPSSFQNPILVRFAIIYPANYIHDTYAHLPYDNLFDYPLIVLFRHRGVVSRI